MTTSGVVFVGLFLLKAFVMMTQANPVGQLLPFQPWELLAPAESGPAPSARADTPSSNVSDIQYLLYTRDNPETADLIHQWNQFQWSHFSAKRPTKILMHGFNANGFDGFSRDVRRAFLEKEDCNVISVNWGKLSGPGHYFVAAENSRLAGVHTADMITFLVSDYGARLEDFHPVGFSLGGQAVGHLGNRLEGKLARVTGLDPAGFLFHTVEPKDRLSPESAQFVDIIHSAGLWMGTDEKRGHVDFYPNSGKAHQPGCDAEDIGLGCSHERVHDLFAESITSAGAFEAVQCDSWDDFTAGLCDNNTVRNFMGFAASADAPGNFYLRTNDRSPYSIDIDTRSQELALDTQWLEEERDYFRFRRPGQ